MNLLFVCTANISRSFLAEQLCRHELRRGGLSGVSVASTGVADMAGSPPDPKMVDYLFQQKIQFEKHRSRHVTAEQLEWADRVFVMEQAQGDFLREAFPDHADKVALLAGFVSPGDAPSDIADPFGLSAFHYRTAISQITLAVRNLVQEIAAER